MGDRRNEGSCGYIIGRGIGGIPGRGCMAKGGGRWPIDFDGTGEFIPNGGGGL